MNYGLFLVKAITILLAIIAVLAFIFINVSRGKNGKGQIEILDINEDFEELEEILAETIYDEDELKLYNKKKKLAEKSEKNKTKKKRKKKKKTLDPSPCLYVLRYDGDMHASDNHGLRECINCLLTLATPKDEVLLILESGGGYVNSYGLGATQLSRIREKKIPLTVAVDEIAASGGYLMAAIANTIIAAPFAIIGSIGVVGQLPNFNRLLEKYDIDYELHTAGAYKRTLTMFGKNTPEAREKYKSEIEEIHELFKKYISDYRPQLNLKKVATGEHWYGTQALALKLIDKISDSDTYIMSKLDDFKIYEITYEEKEPFSERIANMVQLTANKLLNLLVKKNNIEIK